jgi:hypothetical protein
VSPVAQPSSPRSNPRVRAVEATDDLITAYLIDGRMISVPLAWSWRLSDATPEERAHYEIIGDGTGIHWPEVDEDTSVRGMLEGIPARRPASR